MRVMNDRIAKFYWEASSLESLAEFERFGA